MAGAQHRGLKPGRRDRRNQADPHELADVWSVAQASRRLRSTPPHGVCSVSTVIREVARTMMQEAEHHNQLGEKAVAASPCALAILARYPRPGTVKTRLAA